MPDPQVLVELRQAYRRTRPGDQCAFAFPVNLTTQWRADLAAGAGFTIIGQSADTPTTLERQYTLTDTVGTDMRILVVGLNPSPASADAGVGFARPGNRFWPALLSAGMVSLDRNPEHALQHHGVGMTDLVKRTTRRAAELDPQEYRDGTARVESLAEWLAPRLILFVGLAGWRTAVDRKAVAGWQERVMGCRPVYLMPSTSGLNASSQLPDFARHLRALGLGHERDVQ